jgi:predicted kinase
VPAFVAVSGLPASGKSTLASALSQALKYTLLDKDAFLENLFDLEGIGDAHHRRDLSIRADSQFQRNALEVENAVLATWWRHPKSDIDSGTPTAWLLAPGRQLVEVHCLCAARVAADRFAARVRHPGHLDESRSNGVVLQLSREQEKFGPLFPGRAIVVNTEQPVDINSLAEAVKSALLQQHVA